jgi:site-specific DNA-methyltransferase (adenine-specific)
MRSMNLLYYGDNLDVLRRHVAEESIDLVYLDPPFNSNASYNVLFAERDGTQAASQIKAFEDTWRWDEGAARAFEEVVEAGGRVSQAMQAFRTFLGDTDMLAYLAMMAPRLVELRRVMKPTGSLYLHCDPTASHYLKMLLDSVFGAGNFLNEVIWYYRGAGTPKTERARRHDVILWYAKKESEHYFNPDPIRRPYAEATVERFSHHIGNVRDGKDFGLQTLHPLGKHPDDVITHIQPIAPSAKARLGYPTQKPEELLEDIIGSSSREGDLVLDPFCGCGTTIAAAQKLKRQWIGIDITHLAISLIKQRLDDAHGETIRDTYKVIGEPTSIADAEVLAASDPYQFQWWTLGLVGARPAEGKKGADQGIDGRIYFHEGDTAKTKQIILSVKAGKLHATYVRDLRGVMEREKAEICVLLALDEPTPKMRTEAASAGFYTSPWGQHPRLQIVTVGELLAGKRLDIPPIRQTSVTYKRAPKVTLKAAEQSSLYNPDEKPD